MYLTVPFPTERQVSQSAHRSPSSQVTTPTTPFLASPLLPIRDWCFIELPIVEVHLLLGAVHVLVRMHHAAHCPRTLPQGPR